MARYHQVHLRAAGSEGVKIRSLAGGGLSCKGWHGGWPKRKHHLLIGLGPACKEPDRRGAPACQAPRLKFSKPVSEPKYVLDNFHEGANLGWILLP